MKKLFMLLLTLAFALSYSMVHAQVEASKEASPAPAPAATKEPAKIPTAKRTPDPRFVQSAIDEIDKSMKETNYGLAGRSISRLLKIGGIDDATRIKCEDYLAKLKKIGMDKLKEAEGLVQNDLTAAAMLYNELQNWPDNEVRTQAVQAIGKLSSTPALQETFKKARFEAAARVEAKYVESGIKTKNYVGAMFRLLDVIKQYPGTKTAQDCQAKLDELKKNKEFTDAIDQAKHREIGQSMFGVGSGYARYNENDEALKYFKIVTEKFPETDFAKRADELIKIMTGEKAPAEGEARKLAKEENPEAIKKGKLIYIGNNLLRVGTLYSRYGEEDKATKYLKLVIEKFPETDIAKQADAQIKILNGETPAKQ